MLAQLEKGSNIENFNKHSTKIATKKKQKNWKILENSENYQDYLKLQQNLQLNIAARKNNKHQMCIQIMLFRQKEFKKGNNFFSKLVDFAYNILKF